MYCQGYRCQINTRSERGLLGNFSLWINYIGYKFRGISVIGLTLLICFYICFEYNPFETAFVETFFPDLLRYRQPDIYLLYWHDLRITTQPLYDLYEMIATLFVHFVLCQMFRDTELLPLEIMMAIFAFLHKCFIPFSFLLALSHAGPHYFSLSWFQFIVLHIFMFFPLIIFSLHFAALENN